ncbi:hypothetical protein Ddc_10415 [Ditylenchus destructor]|nr:hypothetical protein Ddc_10415 [Ditylenchus destructor]
MKVCVFIAAVACLLYNANVEAGNPLKKLIKKGNDQITTFFTADQITKLANGAASDYLAGKSMSDIGNNAFNTGMGILSIQQKTQGMAIITGLMNDLGGPSQANVTLNKVIPPVWKIVSPLADKVIILLYYQLLIPIPMKEEIICFSFL